MPQKCRIFKGFPVLDCFREDVILWQICGRWNKGLKRQAPFAAVTFVEITEGTRPKAACLSYTAKRGGFTWVRERTTQSSR